MDRLYIYIDYIFFVCVYSCIYVFAYVLAYLVPTVNKKIIIITGFERMTRLATFFGFFYVSETEGGGLFEVFYQRLLIGTDKCMIFTLKSHILVI